jgi:hypothetical protein
MYDRPIEVSLMRSAFIGAIALCSPALALAADDPRDVRINEVRIDHPGAPQGVADKQEFVELAGAPGTSLHGIRYVVIGDSGPERGNSGTIEKIINLDKQQIGPSGRFVIAQSTFTLAGKNHTTTLAFEDRGTVTHMLVTNLVGASQGTNIDTEYDGHVDKQPWDHVLDAIAIVDSDDDTLPYGPGGMCEAGPTCNQITSVGDPSHFYRSAATGTWLQGAVDPLAADAADSPTAANP